MSYDSSNLTTPDIKWLGVRPSDLDRFNIPQQCRLPMTEEDIKTGKKLVSVAHGINAFWHSHGHWMPYMVLYVYMLHQNRGRNLNSIFS